jgi:hypothetical protein
MKYDIFYVSNGIIDLNDWKIFKSRFPTAQKIDKLESINQITSKSFTKMFWIVWDDVVIKEEFEFNYSATKWDEQYVHVFKNGNHYNGICLFPKSMKITNKEFRYRFFINKKEIDIPASDPKIISSNFDIVFISYKETYADNNWNNLKTRFPRSIRVSGIKGIHQAHIEAAKKVKSEMFWVVDADAKILEDFLFTYNDPEKHTVHVWRSLNPINGLEYGYGGVKLLPTEMTLNMDLSKPDMTTSISNKFTAVPVLSNYTLFNTDPFSTWRSAFRECVKLSSKVIENQIDNETEHRLEVWCNKGLEKEFGNYSIDGAIRGKEYGNNNKNNIENLKKINDFDWLEQEFKKYHG